MTVDPQLVVIWMDPSIGKEGSFEELKARFHGMSGAISRWIHVDNEDRLRNAIEQNADHQLILIITGGCAKRTLGLFSLQLNIHSVYIFCVNPSNYTLLVQQEPKIRAVCNDEYELYRLMQTNIAREFP